LKSSGSDLLTWRIGNGIPTDTRASAAEYHAEYPGTPGFFVTGEQITELVEESAQALRGAMGVETEAVAAELRVDVTPRQFDFPNCETCVGSGYSPAWLAALVGVCAPSWLGSAESDGLS
jgi:hypothetical protein